MEIELRPHYSIVFDKNQKKIINLCKLLEKKKNEKKLNKKQETIQKYNYREQIYSFVYKNIKKINLVKSIEEFEIESEEEYYSDLEY